jgi:hypothetical protein
VTARSRWAFGVLHRAAKTIVQVFGVTMLVAGFNLHEWDTMKHAAVIAAGVGVVLGAHPAVDQVGAHRSAGRRLPAAVTFGQSVLPALFATFPGIGLRILSWRSLRPRARWPSTSRRLAAGTRS